MRTEKLTVKAQEALQQAQALARKRDHQAIDLEHLLLALLQQEDGVARPLLERIGANARQVESRLGLLEGLLGLHGQLFRSHGMGA
jgi:ATP-dependent Clp protease ATP-binding subunit ClpB